MPSDLSPVPASTPAPRRRWLRLTLLSLGILLFLLIAFHRLLGHWAIRHFGEGALAKAGITSSWKSSGSLLSGLSLDGLKMSGDDLSPIRSVTMDHVMLDYDLWELRGGGPGKILKELVVRNLDAEIDLTRPGRPKPAPPTPTVKKPVKLPAVSLPMIRMEHVSLRMRMKNGNPLVVEDFSLILDPAKPGTISVSRLVVPHVPEMRDIRGITSQTPTTITFDQLSLTPDTVLEHVLIDVARLQDAQASVDLAAHQAETMVKIQGSSGGWFSEIWADASVRIEHISQASLERWGLKPGSVSWSGDAVSLTAKGPVLRPDQLEADITLAGGGFSVPTFAARDIALKAKLGAGILTISQMSAAAGSNRITAEAQAAMPQTWAKIGRSAGSAAFYLNAEELADLLPPGAEVSGKATAQGSVKFADLNLQQAEVRLNAEDLSVSGVPVESVQALTKLSDGVLRVEQSSVRINAQNTVSAEGQLTLAEPGEWSAQWQVNCENLASVPASFQPESFWPSAGRVVSTGNATGNLAALKARDWTTLRAVAALDVEGLKIRAASLESLKLRAASRDGTATLEEVAVNLDNKNRIAASGTLDLQTDGLPVKANVKVSLPEVAKLSAWSTSFKGPALTGGTVQADWQAEGILKPIRMDGGGVVDVKNLKLDNVPEMLGLHAGIVQSGSNVDVNQFTATAGPWKAAGDLEWDGWHLSIPKMQAWVKSEKLASLSARLPLAGKENGGPVRPDSPISLELHVDQLRTARLAAALGRELPVSANLKADANFSGTLRDLKGGLKFIATEIRSNVKDGPKLDPATVKLEAAVSEGKLTLNGTALQSPLKPLTLSADLPADLPSLMENPAAASALPVRAQVRLPESSLSFLPSWVPSLLSVQGTAALDIAVTGTVGKPVWNGSTDVRIPQATFRSPSLPTVKDVRLKVRADEKKVTIDDASVLLAGGHLRITGGAGLDQPKDPLLDLKLIAEEVLVVRDENLSLRANASLACTGRVSQADVRGTVNLVRGRVFKEIEFLPLSLPNDLPPPPPSIRLGKSGPPSLPPPLDKWNFDVSIKTRDPIRLMGNVARGNAVVDLQLAGAGAAPSLTGKVKLEEMWLKLPFSRLNITKGDVTFNKEQPFDPQIDIAGESLTGGRQVQVSVQGRALDPKVRLTSSPPLPEGEIATLLATGVTTSDLTAHGDEAAGRAAFVLLQQTYRKLFHKRATDAADDEPPRLSFEFSLFGSDPSRRGVSAVYELNPKWRLIGRVGETGTFRGLLYYLIRFR